MNLREPLSGFSQLGQIGINAGLICRSVVLSIEKTKGKPDGRIEVLTIR
jgi:hypothetical protein